MSTSQLIAMAKAQATQRAQQQQMSGGGGAAGAANNRPAGTRSVGFADSVASVPNNFAAAAFGGASQRSQSGGTVKQQQQRGGSSGGAKNNSGMSFEDMQRVLDQQAQRAKERDEDHKAEMLEREKLWEASASFVVAQLQLAHRAGDFVGGGGVPAGTADDSNNNRKKPHRKPAYDRLEEDADLAAADGEDSQQQKGGRSGGLVGIPSIQMRGSTANQITHLSQNQSKLAERQDVLERKLVAMSRKAGRPPSSSSDKRRKGSTSSRRTHAAASNNDDDDDDAARSSSDSSVDYGGLDTDGVSQKSKPQQKSTSAKASGGKKTKKKPQAADDDSDDPFDNVPLAQRARHGQMTMPTTNLKDFVDDSDAVPDKKRKKGAQQQQPKQQQQQNMEKEAPKRRGRGNAAAAAATAEKTTFNVIGSHRNEAAAAGAASPAVGGGGAAGGDCSTRNPLVPLLPNSSNSINFDRSTMDRIREELAALSDSGNNVHAGASSAVVHLLFSNASVLTPSSQQQQQQQQRSLHHPYRALVDIVRGLSERCLETTIDACHELANLLLASPVATAASAASEEQERQQQQQQQQSHLANQGTLQRIGEYLGWALSALSAPEARPIARTVLLDTTLATLGGILRQGLRPGSHEMAERARQWIGFTARMVCSGSIGAQVMFPSQTQRATVETRRDALALALEVSGHFIAQGSSSSLTSEDSDDEDDSSSSKVKEMWSAVCDALDWPERTPPLQIMASALLQSCVNRLRTQQEQLSVDGALNLVNAFRLLSHVVGMQNFGAVLGTLHLEEDQQQQNQQQQQTIVTPWHVARGCLIGFLVADFALSFDVELPQTPGLLPAMHTVVLLEPSPTDALLDMAQMTVTCAVLDRDRAEVQNATAAAGAGSEDGGSAPGDLAVAASLVSRCCYHVGKRAGNGGMAGEQMTTPLSGTALQWHSTSAMATFLNSGE